jgi:hypothetical protein
VDFESAVPLLADQKANRVARWEEKGVVFTLAHDPQQTKGKGDADVFHPSLHRPQGTRLRDGHGADSGTRHVPETRLVRDGLVLGLYRDTGAARSI